MGGKETPGKPLGVGESGPTNDAISGVKGRAVSNDNLSMSVAGIGSSGASPTSQQQIQISPSTGVVVQNMPNASTVPEFLYQLTRMLTDNNRDTIEWSHGKCKCFFKLDLAARPLLEYFDHERAL